jgi:predicted dehydrogenase
MSDNYQITYLCNIFDSALSHCQKKFLRGTIKTTCSTEEVCASPDVVVVLIANSDAFHVLHLITALRYNKIVFVEKPMALRKSKLSAMFSKSCSRR